MMHLHNTGKNSMRIDLVSYRSHTEYTWTTAFSAVGPQAWNNLPTPQTAALVMQPF